LLLKQLDISSENVEKLVEAVMAFNLTEPDEVIVRGYHPQLFRFAFNALALRRLDNISQISPEMKSFIQQVCDQSDDSKIWNQFWQVLDGIEEKKMS
jgi:hypothetical protein